MLQDVNRNENKQLPLVSVICPVYNVEKYISTCLDTILNNTYKNIEVIVINDGSTDNSLEICNKYMNLDERVQVYTKTNGGLSSARNFGVEKSKGKYIAFIDTDDCISERYFETFVDCMEKYDIDLVACKTESVNEDYKVQKEIGKYSCEIFENEDVIKVQTIPKYAHSKMYKADRLHEVRFHGRFMEDRLFNAELICSSEKFRCGYVNLPMYFYVQRSGSLMKSSNNYLQIPIGQRMFSLAGTYKLEWQNRFMVRALIKLILNCRYTATVEKDLDTYSSCKKMNKEIIPYIRKYSFDRKERITYSLFLRFPKIYRLFRIQQDPTLLQWEKQYSKS